MPIVSEFKNKQHVHVGVSVQDNIEYKFYILGQ